MMKKLLLTQVLLLALCASSAFAQVRLIINAPASIAGTVLSLNLPSDDGSWGFNDIDTMTLRTADIACVPTPDTLACNALPAGSLAGKIALIHRGTCQFGCKAFNCQNAGAVGVIIINNQPGSIGMAGGDCGLDVTIPVLMIDQAAGNNIKQALCNGGNVSMGSYFNFYDNNISFDKATEAAAMPAAAFPTALIRGAGDFAFTPNIFYHNIGRVAQTNTMAKCSVRLIYSATQSYPQTIYADSIVWPSIDRAGQAGDTALATFADFDITTAVPSGDYIGIYELRYDISSPSGDQDPTDNSIVYEFRITDKYHSLGKLDPVTNELPPFSPVSPQLTSASNRSYRFGPIFETPTFNAGEGLSLDSIRLGVSVGTDSVDLASVQITIEVNEWNDADNSGTISDAELNQIGSGLLSFTDNSESGKYFTAPIDDAVSGAPGPIALQADKVYLVTASYQGDDIAAFSGVSDEYSYARRFVTIPGLISPLFIDGTWAVGFSNAWAAYRIGFVGTAVANKPGIKTIAAQVFPNPAREYIDVQLGTKAGATLEIQDMSGRVLKTQVTGTTATSRVSTAGLPNGMYHMIIRSAEGVAVKKFSVAK